jgi:hypothetical protein
VRYGISLVVWRPIQRWQTCNAFAYRPWHVTSYSCRANICERASCAASDKLPVDELCALQLEFDAIQTRI